MLKTSLAPVDLGRRRHRSDAARAGHELPAASLSRLFKAAIWGLSVDKEISLGAHAKIVAFDDLPSSFVKERLVQRAKPWGEGFAWMSQSYFDRPTAAYIRTVPKMPYIRRTNEAFVELEAAYEEARRLWTFLEVAGAGKPLAFAYWFEYADRSLDLLEVQNVASWSLPEVAPHIRNAVKADARLEADLTKFTALPKDFGDDLLRSANRFALSQFRKQAVDRILDQALAFEIAVSGKGDTAPPSWKVSVRTAQMIGGSLEVRQANREKLAALYKLRNQATHGGRLEDEKAKATVDETAAVFPELFRSFLRQGKRPDWATIEIEPVFRD